MEASDVSDGNADQRLIRIFKICKQAQLIEVEATALLTFSLRDAAPAELRGG